MSQARATAPSEKERERESDEALAAMQNEVVARSDIGTAFYLFSHQAGGHKPFLRSAMGEVCKPAIPLELQFYQALDTRFPQLKAFVPPFVGVITVDLHPVAPSAAATPSSGATDTETETETASAGEPTATVETAAEAPDSENDTVAELPPQNPHHDTISDSSETQVVEGEMMQALQLHSPTRPIAGAITPVVSTTPSPSGKKRRLDDTRRAGASSSPSPPPSPSGPMRSFISTASYSAKLWKKERSKADALGRTGSNSGLPLQPQEAQQLTGAKPTTRVSREYLVLGDLTLAYSRPCVLDIKMGTRQHGEDAPPAKATSHTAKCAATTSLELGLRICGMQVYDEVEQRYILWDKHWGRQLKRGDIEPALATYLSNGLGLHRDSLRTLRDKLRDLQRVIARTTGVRFWGASLLLIYEGDRRHAPPREDLHLIDFAHCQMCDALTSPDEGLLLGLANLIQFLSTIDETHAARDTTS